MPILGLSLAGVPVLSAQSPGSTLDPPDNNCQIAGRVIPYAPLRQADVMWERRVWRTVDMTEKANQPLLTPQIEGNGCLGLFGVIRHGLLDEGAITAYDPGPLAQDDAFRTPLNREAVQSLFIGLDTLPQGSVTRFMIKEDWIFDKQRGVMEVRIIGISPMLEVRGEEGELRGYRPLFWLYYPECRILFSHWPAIKREDDEPISYEAVFAARHFSSTIVKVSNMQDRMIDDHSTGLDALLESEEIRQQLLKKGFDLWNY